LKTRLIREAGFLCFIEAGETDPIQIIRSSSAPAVKHAACALD
jgi:hypothetical protein